MTETGLLGISGRTAVISGSTRGVGLAAAGLLGLAGANVVLNYVRNDAVAAAELERLKGLGISAIAVKADVSDEEAAGRLIEAAVSEFGRVDILVNNAHGNITRVPLVSSTWQEHSAQLDGILRSAYNLSRAVLPGMQERRWGRIVNVGNNMVLQPIRGYSALTSAMASLTGFTRNLAAEYGPRGVTVNLVAPGFVVTDNMPHVNENVLKAITDTTPLRRLATPEDVAGAILFFCSDLSRFVTGTELSVDGGKIMS